MTKTKSQLRAEAVERLRNHVANGGYALLRTIIDDEEAMKTVESAADALIDLLTDDCDTECYSCSRLAELVAENSQLRVKVDAHSKAHSKTEPLLTEQSESLSDETKSRVITSHNELFEALEEREADSREKLEADVRKHYCYTARTLMYPDSANKSTDMLRALPVETVMGWLDRQASITAREVHDDIALVEIGDAKALNDGFRLFGMTLEDINSLRKDNAELRAKNDKLREKVKHQAEQLAEVQDALHKRNEEIKPKWEKELKKARKENAELQARVDELERENSRLSSDEFYLRCKLVDIESAVVS